jgi:hypothetical protein
MLPSPSGCRLGLRSYHFRGHHCGHCCYGLVTRHLPTEGAVDRLQDLVEYPCRSPPCDTNCCLPEGQTRWHSRREIFRGSTPSRSASSGALHLARFRAYALPRLLSATPQGSILCSRRTITQAGVPPARTRGLARPHCPGFFYSPRPSASVGRRPWCAPPSKPNSPARRRAGSWAAAGDASCWRRLAGAGEELADYAEPWGSSPTSVPSRTPCYRRSGRWSASPHRWRRSRSPGSATTA